MPKVVKIIKLQIPAGKATPAPPVGTVLGPAGVNIGDFVNKFNEATKDKMGDIIPVDLSVYEDPNITILVGSTVWRVYADDDRHVVRGVKLVCLALHRFT